MLDELDALAETRYVAPYQYAIVYMHLGETARALDLFEQAVEERSWITRIYKVSPTLDPVRPHPRFQALLAQLGLAD